MMIKVDFENNVMDFKVPTTPLEMEYLKNEVYFVLGSFLCVKEKLEGEPIDREHFFKILELSKGFASAIAGDKLKNIKQARSE